MPEPDQPPAPQPGPGAGTAAGRDAGWQCAVIVFVTIADAADQLDADNRARDAVTEHLPHGPGALRYTSPLGPAPATVTTVESLRAAARTGLITLAPTTAAFPA